jgi:hypothetical protein
MEFFVATLLKDALFPEVVTLIVSLRLIWSQLLSEELSDHRGVPLILYIPRRGAWLKSVIRSQIEMLRGSKTHELHRIVSEEKRLRELVLRYNVVGSERQYTWILFYLLGIMVACYYNPLVLASLLISDLLVARIHHHIISSL